MPISDLNLDFPDPSTIHPLLALKSEYFTDDGFLYFEFDHIVLKLLIIERLRFVNH